MRVQTSVSVFGLNLPVAGRRVEYARDRDGRVIAIRPPGSEEWLCYERGPDGALVIRAESGREYVRSAHGSVELGNGTAERLTLDLVGRPARIEVFGRDGAPVVDLGYAYDAEGRIERLGPHRISYHDDRIAAVDGTELEHDARGNLLARGDERFRVTDDRVVAAGSVRFEYEGGGNRSARIEGASRTEYRYDGEGRLAEVVRDGELLVAYGYDRRGRRVRRERGDEVVQLHYDAEGNLLAETDDEGRAIATYIRDGRRCLARIDGPVGESAAEWYHLDHAGTAWAVTDADGEVIARRSGPLDSGPGPFMGRFRDEATGFHDFGARDYDDATGRFVTPDSYTFDDDDPRLERSNETTPALRHWAGSPALRNRYAFCLGDPVNNVDLDGHSAWWFFLTIPSSLIWAIPNTIVALTIVIVNLYMEVIGWIVWPFMMIAHKDTGVKYYPWGYGAQNPTPPAQPTNPYSPDMRNHFWLWLDASTRLGVPWALINGSFCSVGRAFTLGNVVFFDMLANFGEDGDANQRYVVPKDPDTQLTLLRSTREHEMQHTFQYAYLGPLFHCLPIGMVPRLITNAALAHGRPLNEREEWWTKFDLAGLVTLVDGLLLYPLTFGKVKFADVETWFNPAHWWQHLFPGRWTDILTQAINMDNWMPPLGIYELDMLFRGGQGFSWFERNSGAWSGNTYGTVVETEKDEIFVGEFTRVIGADVPQAPNATTAWPITWGVSPAAPLPSGSPGSTAAAAFDPTNNFINLDRNNTLPVKVTNGNGIYFHATSPGQYTVTGNGKSNRGRTSESVTITVKDIGVVVQTNVFICQSQVLAISGDGNAAYSIRFQNGVSASGGSISGLGYTAGPTAGTDVIEVVATYAPTAGVFKTYGDTTAAVAAFGWVVKTISITVKEPTITPSATQVFVGGKVTIAFDLPPQTSASTALVPNSVYDQASRTFAAGRGAITAEQTETLTFGYGCKQYTVTIKVEPIVATAPASVPAGGAAQVNVSGGTAPYTFEIVVAGTSGPSISATGLYHAGTTAAPATDVVTATDANGGRGTVSIAVTP